VVQTVAYQYDVYDRLVSRTIDADGAGTGAPVSRFHSFDGHEIALVLDSSGIPTNRMLNGPAVDQILADESITVSGSVQTSVVRWTAGDQVGSIRDLVVYDGNVTSTVSNHRVMDAFGRVISETNASVDSFFALAGGYYDESTQLSNFRHRWMDHELGRWLSEDPIGFGGGDTNLQRYVGNAATSATDPSGLQTLDDNADHSVFEFFNRLFEAGFTEGQLLRIFTGNRVGFIRPPNYKGPVTGYETCGSYLIFIPVGATDEELADFMIANQDAILDIVDADRKWGNLAEEYPISIAEDHVNFICTNARPAADDVKELLGKYFGMFGSTYAITLAMDGKIEDAFNETSPVPLSVIKDPRTICAGGAVAAGGTLLAIWFKVRRGRTLVAVPIRTFPNQMAENLAEEMAAAANVGAKPIPFGADGTSTIVNSGTVKFVVTESGELIIAPHTVRGVEISHAVLAGGKPVVTAGQAEIAAGGGKFIGMRITEHSGHYMPSAESLSAATELFKKFGVVFPE
jgi:RHS repeat-associated protein